MCMRLHVPLQGDQEGADISYCAAGERETGTHVSGTAPLGRPGHARPRPGCRSDDCCSHSPDQDGRDAGTLRMGGKQPLPGTPGSQAMSNVLASHLSCAACQDWMVACHALSCGHMFCGTCLATCLERSNSCPSCRRANAGAFVEGCKGLQTERRRCSASQVSRCKSEQSMTVTTASSLLKSCNALAGANSLPVACVRPMQACRCAASR